MEDDGDDARWLRKRSLLEEIPINVPEEGNEAKNGRFDVNDCSQRSQDPDLLEVAGFREFLAAHPQSWDWLNACGSERFKIGFGLFWVVEHEQNELLQYLLKLEPEKALCVDNDGRTALHHAASLLNVEACGADPVARCKKERTPLMWMVEMATKDTEGEGQSRNQPRTKAPPPNSGPTFSAITTITRLFYEKTNLEPDVVNRVFGQELITRAFNKYWESLAVWFLSTFVRAPIRFEEHGNFLNFDDDATQALMRIPVQQRVFFHVYYAAHLGYRKYLRRVASIDFTQFEHGCDKLIAHAISNNQYETVHVICKLFIENDAEEALQRLLNVHLFRNRSLTTMWYAVYRLNYATIELLLSMGGNIDERCDSLDRPDRMEWAYRRAIMHDRADILELLIIHYNQHNKRFPVGQINKLWGYCVDGGAIECLRVIDHHFARPRWSFLAEDWDPQTYVCRWVEDSEFRAYMPGISLTQKFLRECTPYSRRDPNRLWTDMGRCLRALKIIIDGENTEDLGWALQMEMLFVMPFVRCPAIRKIILQSLPKWPFRDDTLFDQFDGPIIKHFARAEALYPGVGQDVMRYGLRMEMKQCPCCDCKTADAINPRRSLVSLAINCSEFFLRIPMCPKMNAYFREAKGCEKVCPIASLASHCRATIRRQIPMNRLVDDEEWVDDLLRDIGVRDDIKQYLLHKTPAHTHFRVPEGYARPPAQVEAPAAEPVADDAMDVEPAERGADVAEDVMDAELVADEPVAVQPAEAVADAAMDAEPVADVAEAPIDVELVAEVPGVAQPAELVADAVMDAEPAERVADDAPAASSTA
ncbi:unnamed protein product, partial [Mesorhabditis spiculigera]